MQKIIFNDGARRDGAKNLEQAREKAEKIVTEAKKRENDRLKYDDAWTKSFWYSIWEKLARNQD